jgi:RNA polymerase sigma-70 factor (ECF subfamily)
VLGNTGDRALAEDLAQEVFIKAYIKLSSFDTSRRLSSWLFRIAHNTALDALRRSRVRGVSEADSALLDGPAATAAPVPDPVETEALGVALEAAMAQLRPEFRAAITLRYEEGLPFEEVAHVLGVAEATARSFVHRARKQLAAHLTEAGWRPT